MCDGMTTSVTTLTRHVHAGGSSDGGHAQGLAEHGVIADCERAAGVTAPEHREHRALRHSLYIHEKGR